MFYFNVYWNIFNILQVYFPPSIQGQSYYTCMKPLCSIFALVCIYLHIMHALVDTQLAVFCRILFDRFIFSGQVYECSVLGIFGSLIRIWIGWRNSRIDINLNGGYSLIIETFKKLIKKNKVKLLNSLLSLNYVNSTKYCKS